MTEVKETSSKLPDDDKQATGPENDFLLLGVGASAGGLDAIKRLIADLPPDFPHSFIFIQHISPDHQSFMSQILSREVPLKVAEIQDGMPIEPGRVYVNPPRSNVVVRHSEPVGKDDTTKSEHRPLKFVLTEQAPRPSVNLPIDAMFLSLAEVAKHNAVAIVLSGSGSDGSRGLNAIKDHDGFVIVQDPDSAEFDSMPTAAIATGLTDLILPPEAIVNEVLEYRDLRKKGEAGADQLFQNSEKEFEEILELVTKKTDIDFLQYKRPTLMRRLARRLTLRELGTLAEYLEYLKNNSTEVNILHREFLVGVTNFFRDLPVWRALEDKVLEDLFASGDVANPLKIWCVGCSTGEEAYTITALLEKYREDNDIARDFRVYATDVNEESIKAAKQGIYPENVLDEIPSEYLSAGFIERQAGTFSLSQRIRSRIIFSIHNVIEEAPFIGTDLIVCRNLLIYVSPEIQVKAQALFSFSLRKDGYLLLGAAETPSQNAGKFQPIDAKLKIFQNTRPEAGNSSLFRRTPAFSPASFLPRLHRLDGGTYRSAEDVTRLLTDTLSTYDAFACVIDEQCKMIRTFGDYKTVLEVPDTGFSSNILDLVPSGLRSTMVLILREAEKSGLSERNNVRFTNRGLTHNVSITCTKTEWEGHAIAFALQFRIQEEKEAEISVEEPELATNIQMSHVAHLEAEIQSLQDMLSATSEDLGASNEELQTTNEELIASNEELQANNEETQSINEELHTVNAENTEKIVQLEAATGDINNLLATAELGILLLDRDLCIRRFSVGLTHHIKLNPNDEGRKLENFATTLVSNAMDLIVEHCQRVLSTGVDCALELKRRDGGWAYVRIRPYRNILEVSDGVVLSFLDITQNKELEKEVRQQRDQLEALLESEAAGYWDWNIPSGNHYMSPSFKSMFGYEEKEIQNSHDSLRRLIHPDDFPIMMDSFDNHIKSRGADLYSNELRGVHKDGSTVWILRRGRVTEWSDSGAPIRMMGVHFDITQLKKREEEVRRRAEEIRRFAFVAAHDLTQPILTIENSMEILINELPANSDPSQNQVKDFLRTATARLRSRIRGVLEYSRLQDNQTEFESLNTEEILSDCLKDLQSQISDARAEVSVSRLPVAKGVKSLIAQVFQNLISNSIKYREASRPCRILVEGRHEPNGRVSFSVSDNGIGVPPKNREKIFELFSRLHSDDEIEGNGLGLALCERIVSLHGGTIFVTDGIDGGATVTFMLEDGRNG